MADVSVTFGANTSEFTAALAIAQKELQNATREMNRLAAQAVSGKGDLATASAGVNLYAKEVDAAKARIESLSAAMRQSSTAVAAAFNRNQLMESTHVLRAMFDEAMAGGNIFRALALESGRISQIIAEGQGGIRGFAAGLKTMAAEALAGNAAMFGLGGAAGAIAGTLGYLAYQAQEAKTALDSLILQSLGAGNVNNTAQGLRVLHEAMAAIPGASSEASDALAGMAARVNDAGNVIGLAVANSVVPFAELSGKDVPAAMDALTRALESPATAGRALIESIAGFTESERQAFDSAVNVGDAHKELGVILGALARIFKSTGDQAGDAGLKTQGFWRSLENAAKKFFEFGTASEIAASWQGRFADEARKASGVLSEAAANADKFRASLHDLVAQANQLAIKDNLLPDQLNQGIERAELLKRSLEEIQNIKSAQGATGETADIIRATATRLGVDPVTALRVAQSEGLNSYVGDQGSSFGPFQLHYGGIAPGANSVPGLGDEFTRQTGLDARDPGTITAQVEFALRKAIQNGWGAFHGAARAGIGNREGLPGGSPPQYKESLDSEERISLAHDEEIAKNQKLREQIKAQNDEHAGGNAIQREELAIAERNAKGRQNDVQDARDRLSAARAELAEEEKIGAGATAKAHAREIVAQREHDLQERIRAAKKAQYDLDAANAPKGSRDALNAKLAKAGVDLGAYAPGTPQHSAALLAQRQAKDAFDQAQARDAESAENEKYNAAKNGLAERLSMIREEAQAKQLSAHQVAEQELAVEDDRLQIEKAHWQKLKEIWGQGTAQYRQAEQKLILADSDSTKRRLQTQTNLQKSQAQQFNQMWDQMTGQLNGAIMSALTGRSKDAGRQFAMQLANDVGNMLLKAVENSLKNAILAGPLGSVFTGLAGAIGLTGFASGSWELPHDMVAQVHKGEMIVPAGPAAAIRSGQMGLGGGGAAVSHQSHVHIHAVDAQSLARHIQSNDSAVMKALEKATRRGLHLALSRRGTL